MKYAVVCAGGPDSEIAELDRNFIMENTVFIGADRGALHLLKEELSRMKQWVILIRFRKVNMNRLAASVQIIGRFHSEKDETDTELAVERALSYSPEHVILTGVTGGRLDHMESALHLLYRLQTEHQHILIFNSQSDE